MKARLAVGVLAMCVAFSANADTKKDGKVDGCAEVSGLANSLMSARQAGAPMSRLMAVARDAGEDKDLVASMVEEAYEVPAYSTKEVQMKVISDFENKWYLRCYKANK